MFGVAVLPRVAAFLVVLSVCSTAMAQDVEPGRYTVLLGAAYARWSRGLLSIPVLWTAPAAEVAGAFERTSARTVQELSIGFGRSGAVSVDGAQRAGQSGTHWFPIDYHLTWLRGGRTFGIPNLRWGIGATAQFLAMTQSVETDPGRSTRHRDRHVGAGVNGGFRWRDDRSRWAASFRGWMTLPVPGLSRWSVRSDLTPGGDGPLFAAQLGLLLRVERRMHNRWLWAVSYERDSTLSWRSSGSIYSPSQSISYGSVLLTHLTGHVGYEWNRAR